MRVTACPRCGLKVETFSDGTRWPHLDLQRQPCPSSRASETKVKRR